jgi:hypothetical protein
MPLNKAISAFPDFANSITFDTAGEFKQQQLLVVWVV